MKTWVASILLLAVVRVATAGPEVDPGNLLQNGGFEVQQTSNPDLPQGWNYFSSSNHTASLIGSAAHEGKRCLLMRVQGVRDGFQGVVQGLPVVGGDKYMVEAWVKTDSTNSMKGTACVKLEIEWVNKDFKGISRHSEQLKDSSLSKTHWEKMTLKGARAPKDAVRANVGIVLFDGKEMGKGGLLVDHVVMKMD